MEKYEQYLNDKGYKTSTIDRQIKEIQRFINWLARQNKVVYEADYKTVLDYLGHRRRSKISESTLRNYLIALQNYYRYLAAIKVIAGSPIVYLKLRKKDVMTESNNLLIDILSKEELEESYQLYVSNKRLLLRNKVLLGLHVFQGIQSGEEVRLQVEDIDLLAGKIKLKGGGRIEERTLTLDARQMLFLQEWMRGKGSKSYLFEYENRAQSGNVRTNLVEQLNIELSRSSILWRINNLVHIRRSVLVNWLKNKSLRKVQYQAGHRWVSSTERYLRADISALQQAIGLHHPLDGKE